MPGIQSCPCTRGRQATFGMHGQGSGDDTVRPTRVRLVASEAGHAFSSTILTEEKFTQNVNCRELPFRFETSVRGVDISLQVKGTGVLQMDYIQSDYPTSAGPSLRP